VFGISRSAGRFRALIPAVPTDAGGSPINIWLALGALYIVYGSMYLAIRVAIRTMPPFLMAGARYLIAGGLMYAWSIRRGDRKNDRPRAKQWVAATIVGGLLLVGGNGGVVWAEQHVATGIVALLVATTPLWLALLDRIVNRKRLPVQAVVGLVLGFGGVLLLVGAPSSGRLNIAGVLVVIGASVSWAVGSVYARRAALPSRIWVGTAMEMLTGGALLTLSGVVRGEVRSIDPSQFSVESMLALAYQIVFGSWIAFTSYIWLLRVAPLSLVGTHAYVNPIVAVLLGWAILSEPISARSLLASAVIVTGVALIVMSRPVVPGGPVDGTPGARPYYEGGAPHRGPGTSRR